MEYQSATLPSGLRVVCGRADMPVVFCGYQLLAGTAYEAAGEEGLAHFCEHMSFKGTRRRRAWHIINRLESVGGDLNAYTNKEETAYHAAVLPQHVGRAVELLTDIVFHSVYPQREIDREVEVICDEIASYEDSPYDLIFDEFEAQLFHGGPLGRSVLGTAESVRRFTTADAARFTGRWYRPERAVFYALGQVDFPRLVRQLERLLPQGEAPVAPINIGGNPNTSLLTPNSSLPTPNSSLLTPNSKEVDRHTSQAHVMLGCEAFPNSDPRHPAIDLLTSYLGGSSMNARLNMELRERRGLVYTVEAAYTSYHSTGHWSVYFGCDHHDVDRCLGLVRRALADMASRPLPPSRLAAAVRQRVGQLRMASLTSQSFSQNIGWTYLHFGRTPEDISEFCRRIEALTPEDVQRLAAQLFDPARMTTLIYR